MNSASRPCTVRIATDSLTDHVSAFRIALDLFGTVELTEFLPPREHPRYLEILSELVRLELTHGWKCATPIPLETYQLRFPELFAHPAFALPVVRAEFDLRRESGEDPSMTDYCERFQLPKGGRKSLLDPEVSSKLDIVLDPANSQNYPATSRPSDKPSSSWPSVEIGQTRYALGVEKRPLPSDPEIVWKLNQVMREMPKVGDDFLGFSLLAELGKGAFGKVFLAQQTNLAGRFVALKVATGLFTESQTLAQLQHTHIVPIYSYHHAQPFQAVCMPYLGSTTLAHILADIRTHKSMPSSGKELLSTLNCRKRSTRRGDDSSDSLHDGLSSDQLEHADVPQPHASTSMLELEGMSYVDSILWLAVRLADGLAHAHERGIVHRDLKPANILLTDDGLPMLLDFNLAQDIKEAGSAAVASIGGTLPYMAPEHLDAFRGNKSAVDARSDLYSLGVILFELLTGAAPFASYRKLPVREVLARMIEDRKLGAPSLRTLNPEVPPAVEAIVNRCLAADPESRYRTVRELREDLQCQLENKPLKHAMNPSWRERFRKFRRRHPRLMSMTSVACISLVFIAGLASAMVVREEQHGRLQANATLASFEEDAQTTYFLLNARTAKNQLEEGKTAGIATLRHFQVLENPNWRSSPAVRRLADEDRKRLEGEVGQVLVLMAQAQQIAGDREADSNRRQEILQQGLHFCSLATDCYPADQTPRSLWNQKGQLHERLNERQMAQEAFERAKELALSTAQDRYLSARQLAEDGKFRDALALAREAVRLKPQDFNMHFLQGICHDHLGQHLEAIACYRTCIALRPNFFGAYYNRGLAHSCRSEWQAAVADLDMTLRINPDFLDARIQRAIAFQGMGKPHEAIADLTDALERGSSETRIYFLRAKAREKAGDTVGAKKDRAEGLRLEPADEPSWVTRGIAHLPANPKQALADFDRALEANPRSLAALQNKAHVLGKYLKRTQDAIAVFDKAIELHPDDVRPRAGRGVYLGRLGKRDAALTDAKKALTIDASPATLYQVAGIYALTSKQVPNDEREAMGLLSTALKNGFGFDYLEIDPDLDPLRQSPTFRRVIDGARALQSSVTPGRK